MTPREELVQLQQLLHKKIQTDIDNYLGRPSPAVERYRVEYEKHLTDFRRISDKSELVRNVQKSHLVYCGDYHTLRQAQRTVIRILREVVDERQIILGLEMVNNQFQTTIDKFMAHQISEKQFLEAIDYNTSWNFDWTNYKMLFDFAKKHHIPVFGLNCGVSKGEQILRKRDQVAAKIVSKLALENPQALIFVLYGDLHISPSHIPHLVNRELKKKTKRNASANSLIVYQNSDALYWKLVARGLEQKVDVLKIASDAYCVMNTPPWVKLQTYLDWLEHGQLLEEDSEEELSEFDDVTENYSRFWDILDTIASFLGVSKENLDDFHIYTRGDIAFLDFFNSYLTQHGHNAQDTEIMRAELIYNGTCFLPDENVIYLNRPSLNRAAEKLAQLIQFKLSAEKLSFTNATSIKEYYFGRILLQAIGYFGSKVINYKRKCERIADFVATVGQLRNKRLTGRMSELRDIAKLSLLHNEYAHEVLKTGQLSRNWAKLFNQPPQILFGVTQGIGHLLGESLYEAVMDNGIHKSFIRKLFERPITVATTNADFYFDLRRKLDKHTSLHNSKSDRF